MTDCFRYFDAHCDSLTAVPPLHVELDKERFTERGQVFAVCQGSNKQDPMSLIRRCSAVLPRHKLCGTPQEMDRARSEGRPVLLLSIEGAEVLGCEKDNLDEACALGARIINLTWNIYNGLCGTAVEQTRRGLTERGREFALAALAHRMILDISHASDSSAEELIELSGGAVAATHSNSRALCPNARNLPDSLFRRLCDAGGICGINLYAPFLAESGTPTVSDAADHIERFVWLAGGAEKHVALGCDFDGCDALPAGIASSRDIYRLRDELCRRDWQESSINSLFYDNLYNFLHNAL